MKLYIKQNLFWRQQDRKLEDEFDLNVLTAFLAIYIINKSASLVFIRIFDSKSLQLIFRQ